MFVLGLIDTRQEYDQLSSIYVPIAVAVCVLIWLAVLVAVLRYRRRPASRAARWHEHNPLEASYAVGLTLVAALLLYLSFSAEHRVDTVAGQQRPAVRIDVTAAKWEWQFAYRDYGFSVRAGTVPRQPLVVPLGEPVAITLRSDDVIHAFWVPEVRYKHDAIPGSTQAATLVFSRAGDFEGQCAEFCGLRHSDMVFGVHVVTPSRFLAWARSGGRSPVP